LLLANKNLSGQNHKFALFDLFGFEIGSVTLREIQRLKMFEDGLQRKVFGPEREKEIGGYRK